MSNNINTSSISLHIIAQPAAQRAPKPKTKSNNRYEKRRRKGQQVRQEREQQQQLLLLQNQQLQLEQQHSVVEHVLDKSLVDDKVGVKEQQQQTTTAKTILAAVDEVSNSDEDSAKDDEVNEDHSSSEEDAEDESSKEGDPVVEEPKESVLLLQKSAPAEASHFLNDLEARARYLAEYHARPLELDRRAHAQRTYQPSHSSNHLFDTDETAGSSDKSWDRLVSSLPRLQQWVSQQHTRPTRIQIRAVQAFASANRNDHFMMHSETGSGKTLAYLLPIVLNLLEHKMEDRSQFGTRCLILCPTRELARQTFGTAEGMGRAVGLVAGCLLGDERRKSEKARIRKGLAIVVATPGRLLDHLQRTESLLLHLKQKATSTTVATASITTLVWIPTNFVKSRARNRWEFVPLDPPRVRSTTRPSVDATARPTPTTALAKPWASTS